VYKLLTVLFILIFVLIAFSEEKAQKIKRIDNYIAVFDLETIGEVKKDLSKPLTESISLEVVKSGKYEVIERSNMDKILQEQKFQQSVCTSTECVVEVGQLLGVGKVIMGSVSIVGKTYYLSLKLVNVETGKIENVSEDRCKCEIDDLIDSSKRIAKRLIEDAVPKSQVTAKPKTSTETASGQTYKDPLTGMEFVFVRGGCFDIGDTLGDGTNEEKPAHEICVDDFYIGKYEVTQGEWKKIMSSPDISEDNYPIDGISWDDVQEFLDRLNQKTGKEYRLPTDAEWEYAARSGGKKEKWAGTSNESELRKYAWFNRNSEGKKHPVGQKKPNGLGLHDMSGNVLEWVNDWYDKDYFKNRPRVNPQGPNSGIYKTLRSSCWYGDINDVSTASHGTAGLGIRDACVGFRPAISVN